MMDWVCAAMFHGVIFASAMAAGALILLYWYNRFVERIIGKKTFRLVAISRTTRGNRIGTVSAGAKKAS